MQEASAPFVIPPALMDEDAMMRLRLPPTVLALLALEHDRPNIRFRSIALLALVEMQPGLSTGDCARVLGTPKPAITRLAQSMASYGLLRAQRDPDDKRLSRYTSTLPGKLLLQSLHLAPSPYAAA